MVLTVKCSRRPGTMSATLENRKQMPVKRHSKPRSEAVRSRKQSTSATAKIRTRLGLPQPQFARLLSVSVRSLATLEAGTSPTDSVARRLTELERLVNALSEVLKKESIANW